MVADAIRDAGGAAAASTASVSDPDGPGGIVAAAIDAFGRLDGLVNNAGIVRTVDLEGHDRALWDELQAVHLIGAFRLTQLAFRRMCESGFGRVVTMSSSSGIFGLEKQVGYASLKTALFGLMQAVAREGAEHGIVANAVLPRAPLPGRTKVSRTIAKLGDQGYRLAPEFVAPLVTYLASPACTRSGRLYTGAAGTYSRVAPTLSRGWSATTPRTEAVAAHIDTITDFEAGLVVPPKPRRRVALDRGADRTRRERRADGPGSRWRDGWRS